MTPGKVYGSSHDSRKGLWSYKMLPKMFEIREYVVRNRCSLIEKAETVEPIFCGTCSTWNLFTLEPVHPGTCSP